MLILLGDAYAKRGMLVLWMQTVARDPGRIRAHVWLQTEEISYVATAEERPRPPLPLFKRHSASAVN